MTAWSTWRQEGEARSRANRPSVARRNRRWVAAYDAGATPSQIAAEAGMSIQSVSGVLKAAGRDPAERVKAQSRAERNLIQIERQLRHERDHTYWYWECEAGCGTRSFATFATQAAARTARIAHEKGCPCQAKR